MNDKPQTATNLDQEELLHLALEALRREDHAAALIHLKTGAQRFPDNASIAFLLGAEHAQIGLFDRAEAEFSRAVALDPGLVVCRFQLGLLQLTQARLGDAKLTWAPLEDLPEGHALRLFKQGLEALGEDRFDDARRLLGQGIAANDFNADLSKDMANVIAQIPGDTPPASNDNAAGNTPVWLGAYQNTEPSQ